MMTSEGASQQITRSAFACILYSPEQHALLAVMNNIMLHLCVTVLLGTVRTVSFSTKKTAEAAIVCPLSVLPVVS